MGDNRNFKNKDAIELTSSTSYDESDIVTTSIKVLSSKGEEKNRRMYLYTLSEEKRRFLYFYIRHDYFL